MGERKVRAVEEPLDVRLALREAFPILEVRNPLHGTAYRVLLPEFPRVDSAMCTCTDFARRGLGTCKHIEAGIAWIRDHPDAPPLHPADRTPARVATIWAQVDRALGTEPRSGAPESEVVRRGGSVLFAKPRAER